MLLLRGGMVEAFWVWVWFSALVVVVCSLGISSNGEREGLCHLPLLYPPIHGERITHIVSYGVDICIFHSLFISSNPKDLFQTQRSLRMVLRCFYIPGGSPNNVPGLCEGHPLEEVKGTGPWDLGRQL